MDPTDANTKEHGDGAYDATLLPPPPPPPDVALLAARTLSGRRHQRRRSLFHQRRRNSLATHKHPDAGNIVVPDSVFDDSDRFFHGYKKGKHVLPNVISYASPTAADWSQGGWHRYQLPQAEQDCIDLQHAMLMMVTGGKLAHAPLNHDPEYVMNIATGTRTWPIQFGTYRPDRRHILSSSWVQANKHPKQKESSRTVVNWIGRCSPGAPRAQNCEFVMDDAEGEWLYRTLQTGVKTLLDYVHLRMVFTCFADNQAVMRDAFDSIRPGSWIEYCGLYIDPMSRKGRHERV
ncbi:methyltransferase domain-containing protein [Apiospora kogelbergensis]|uniref:methyltransferase domain-containing protein n=1 Tax=Apiospora kogelbergensis TaxID=1337665 RepID=UPI00313103B1